LNKSEGSLIAELRGLGADLPETLALKQLRDLAALNLEQNNMEGYLAVQQEVIRRFPDSEDGRTAAEMLYLFYSSAESRHFRVRSSMKPSQSMPIPEVSAQSSDPFRPVENALLVQPQLQAAVSGPFSAGASNQMATLMEHWDTHADTALRILSTNATGTNARREISPQIQLRFAASQRLKDRTGGSSNALADLSQRNDEFGIFARSEMQLHAAAVPGLPIFNLPRQTDRPFLDAKLTDTIWENSDEIPLRPFVRSESAADDEAGDVRPVVPSSVHSLTMLAWDAEYLYVAARLERDPSATSAVELATHRSHDAKHENRDRFELEIDTDRDFSTSFQFCIDESGLTSDRCWLLDRWNPKWFVAVDSDESTWRFEAAIPLEELSARPAKPGDLWAVRMRRIQPGVLKHELPSGNAAVSANGTGFIRFIRPKVVTGSRSK
jgi:hypothetical protein